MTAAAKSKAAPRNNQQQMLIIGAIVAAAILAVIILIALSGRSNPTNIDFSSLAKSRSAEGGFVIGDPNAPITIIEFADYACPACHNYLSTVEQFINEFVVTGQAKFEYYVFPTAGGAATAFAGGIAECADEVQPGAFWTAYSRFNALSLEGRYQDAPRILSNELGLSYSDLLTCQQESTLVSAGVSLGQSLQVSGTPAVRVRFGDSAPTFITYAGQTYDRGGVPIDVLRAVVQSAQAS